MEEGVDGPLAKLRVPDCVGDEERSILGRKGIEL